MEQAVYDDLVDWDHYNRKQLIDLFEDNICPECGDTKRFDILWPTKVYKEPKIKLIYECQSCYARIEFSYLLKSVKET